MAECNRWFLLNQVHEAGMPQANLLEGVQISDNRPQTYKTESKKTHLFGTNHWMVQIQSQKIFRRALATEFQDDQVTYSFTLSLLTLHRTVPTRLPMSPSALRLLACTALAALWLPLWGCLPVPAAAGLGGGAGLPPRSPRLFSSPKAVCCLVASMVPAESERGEAAPKKESKLVIT
jgi:hypothetical protein